jgi:hypothetical protein
VVLPHPLHQVHLLLLLPVPLLHLLLAVVRQVAWEAYFRVLVLQEVAGHQVYLGLDFRN